MAMPTVKTTEQRAPSVGDMFVFGGETVVDPYRYQVVDWSGCDVLGGLPQLVYLVAGTTEFTTVRSDVHCTEM